MLIWMRNFHVFFILFLVSLAKRDKCEKSCFKVQIYHLIDNALWGETDGSALQGVFPCSNKPNNVCELLSSDSKSKFMEKLVSKFNHNQQQQSQLTNHKCCTVTVSMYNIHTWGLLSKWPHGPNRTALPTDLTIAESEESHVRFNRLFRASFPLYDANSTTSPHSTIQRVYFRGWHTIHLLPLKPFDSLIKAGAFIASTCHRGSETKRLHIVKQMLLYMRIDSLGKCITSKHIPEGIVLQSGSTEKETLLLKQQTISKYLFYLAFENSFEPGYVTEKVFDALIAGTVPVYLGSAEDCKKLMPHPKAAIYVADFGNDLKKLTDYLVYLTKNQTAYEEHRAWRTGFRPDQSNTLTAKSWPCRICEWAAEKSMDDYYFR